MERGMIVRGFVIAVLASLSVSEFGTYVDAGETEPGLVLWWRFDEGAGEVAEDSSGLGHHGEIHRATWAAGLGNGASNAWSSNTTLSRKASRSKPWPTR